MEERFRRRRLPHWDLPGGTFFATSCLAGSIPALGLRRIHEVQSEWLSRRPIDRSPGWKVRLWKQMFVERERWLDETPGVRHLERPDLASVVTKSLRHFHEVRYDLIAFVVMPSHIHWLFRPLVDWYSTLPPDKSPRELIMHSVLSFSAHECNRLLGQTGHFWKSESYDHCVRDDAELERIVNYIEMNPVKARLCLQPEDWQFSSAFARLHD
jgi:type I restriction enzyme R subunit